MPVDLNNLQTTRYEVVNPGENGIAVVTLNRPCTSGIQCGYEHIQFDALE